MKMNPVQPGSSLFGSPATTGGPFRGTSGGSIFSAPGSTFTGTTSSFTAPFSSQGQTSTPFGGSNTSTFGQPPPFGTNTFTFGTQNPFGSSPSSASAFGSPASQNLFGSGTTQGYQGLGSNPQFVSGQGFGTGQQGFSNNPMGFGTTTQQGFGTGSSGFGTTQQGFGTSQTFGGTQGFNTGQSSFGTNPQGFGNVQTGFTSQGFNTGQSSFGTGGQFGFGSSSQGFGTSQPSFGTQQPFGGTQQSFGTSQPFGVGQSSFGTGQQGFGQSFGTSTGFGSSTTSNPSGFGGIGQTFQFSAPASNQPQSTVGTSSLFGGGSGTQQGFSLSQTSGPGPVTLSFGTGGSSETGSINTGKENILPQPLTEMVESFKNFVKQQKKLGKDMSRVGYQNMQPIKKVREDISVLKNLLAKLKRGIIRNKNLYKGVKVCTLRGLSDIEMAQYADDYPVNFPASYFPPNEYFSLLSERFQDQMISFRLLMEEAEKHVSSFLNPSVFTPRDLYVILEKMHESFIALAGRMYYSRQAFKVLRKEHSEIIRSKASWPSDLVVDPADSSPGELKLNGVPDKSPCPFSDAQNHHVLYRWLAKAKQNQEIGLKGGKLDEGAPGKYAFGLVLPSAAFGPQGNQTILLNPTQTFPLKPPPANKRGKR